METAPSFQLVAGHPVLDYLNTVGGMRGVNPKENLKHFSDLVAWGEQAQVLSRPEARALAQRAAASPQQAEAALERARGFRESLHAVVMALVEKTAVPPVAMAAVEAEVHKAQTQRRLQCVEGVASWAGPEVTLLDSVVPRLALAADELLTSPRSPLLRVCEAKAEDDCGWLFLDTTRNHSRRWCEMASCGNKHKARRHYARVRAHK